eukprot:scaffold77792_cov17-Tisochrysis_lutea.AAC.2
MCAAVDVVQASASLGQPWFALHVLPRGVGKYLRRVKGEPEHILPTTRSVTKQLCFVYGVP